MSTRVDYLDLRTFLERLLLVEIAVSIATALLILFTTFNLVYSAAQNLVSKGLIPQKLFTELFTELTLESVTLRGIVLLILCLVLALTARVRKGMLTRGEYKALQAVSVCELCVAVVVLVLALVLYMQLLSIDLRYGVNLSMYELPGLGACVCLAVIVFLTYVKTRQLLLLRLTPRRL